MADVGRIMSRKSLHKVSFERVHCLKGNILMRMELNEDYIDLSAPELEK